MSKYDGGPAFPTTTVETPQGMEWGAPGMTLRDWFAGQALAGMLASNAHPDSGGYELGNDGKAEDAHHAYRYADAMLKERER